MADKHPATNSPWTLWLTLFSLVAAMGSLWTADSAEKTQTILSEPYLSLVDVMTAPGKTSNTAETSTNLDTSVIIKNSGQTNAVNLTFTSLAWYSARTQESVTDRHGVFYHVQDDLHVTSLWQVSPATDSLDRDQPTTHFFPSVPRLNEPRDATDFLYILAEYDDEFPFPFRRHHTAQFCIEKSPQEADLGPVSRSWNRSPSADCIVDYQKLTALTKGGPIRAPSDTGRPN